MSDIVVAIREWVQTRDEAWGISEHGVALVFLFFILWCFRIVRLMSMGSDISALQDRVKKLERKTDGTRR